MSIAHVFVLYFSPLAAEPRSGVALAGFDGAEWGPDYLTLYAGNVVHSAVEPCAGGGWAYGQLTDGSSGWYPPEYVKWD